ncbi:ATPase, T2SS/T4P/T4SS family [Achromobacter sp. 413638]|uniref:ATPase, T2SS/T4P/T4SS family n=1 Tax=Achromobacter sp. 413638 TaxID=3342385 RepID=UPI00370A6029
MIARLRLVIRKARDRLRSAFGAQDVPLDDASLITLPAVSAPTASIGPPATMLGAAPPQELESLADIERIDPPFRTLKVDWCGSAAAVIACVAELEGDRYAVFAKRGQRDSDIFRAVMARATQAAEGQPVAVYTVSPVVLLTLVRERMQAQDLRQRSLRERGGSGGRSGGRSAVRTGFHDLVAWAARTGASDLHLHIDTTSAISKVSATIDGQYTTPASLAMPTERMLEMARVAWLEVSGGNGMMLDMTREQQGRLYEVVDDRSYMLRWGSFIADQGPSITLRILEIDAKVQAVDLHALGYLPSQVEQFERVLRSQGGAVVMGGVPGSGKTVTQGQLVVRHPPTDKVATIEDPVELLIPRALQASVARAIDGSDVETMQAKLMALKRAAAHVVLLGETRDRLTGAAFQDIVQSGSRLYTTLHVGSAFAIPERLASVQIGIPRGVLGSPQSLKLLAYQALLPVLCDCALPAEVLRTGAADRMGITREGRWWDRYLAHIEKLYDFGYETMRIRNPEGCPHCRAKGLPELIGYRGRTVVAELFEPGMDTDALRAIAAGDELRLHQIYAARRTAAFNDPDMEGKTAMQCAVYKMSLGTLDPRDIEPHFMSFLTLQPSNKSP